MKHKTITQIIICNNYFTVHPCDTTLNGGCSQICKKAKDKYACACEDGFLIQKDGKTCVKGLIWYCFFAKCLYITVDSLIEQKLIFQINIINI